MVEYVVKCKNKQSGFKWVSFKTRDKGMALRAVNDLIHAAGSLYDYSIDIVDDKGNKLQYVYIICTRHKATGKQYNHLSFKNEHEAKKVLNEYKERYNADSGWDCWLDTIGNEDERKTNDKYPHRCISCNHEAYNGAFVIECSNRSCKYYK